MKRTFLNLIIWLFLCGFACYYPAYAKTIENSDPFFRIDIPDNFEALTANELPRDWDAGYRERTGLEDKQPISIGIDITEEPLEQSYEIDIDQIRSHYPKDTIIEKRFFRALGFDLEGIKATFKAGPVQSIIYLVQIPTTPRSIGLIIGGTAERKDDILDIVKSVTSSIQAPTNWSRAYTKKNKFSFLWLILFAIILFVRIFRRIIRDIIRQIMNR